MMRILVRERHGDAIADKFKGSFRWRARYAKRFNLTIRRKTNCKNTSWEETKPVLIRYFLALRRRLQLPPFDAREVASLVSSWAEGTEEPWRATAAVIDAALDKDPAASARLSVTDVCGLSDDSLLAVERARLRLPQPAHPGNDADADADADVVMSDPEDVNGDDECGPTNAGDVVLDSEDDEDEHDEVQAFAPPGGRVVSQPPTQEQLAFRDDAGTPPTPPHRAHAHACARMCTHACTHARTHTWRR